MRTIVIVYSLEHPLNGIISTIGVLDNKLDNIRMINWNPSTKPVFDMFDELKPDLIICNATTAPTMQKAIDEYGTKLIVCGGIPPNNLKPDLVLFSDLVPDMVKKHCESPYINVKKAANLGKFRGGKFEEDKKTDVLYYASQPTSQTNEADILSILSGMSYQFKIIGYRRPLIQYIGQTSVYETANFFASAKLSIDIGGQQEYDIAAQKGCCLSNQDSDLFPSVTDVSVEQWSKRIEELLEKDKLRASIAKSAYKKVISEHTYFHRLVDIFNNLGWSEEAEQTSEILKELTSK